MSSRSSLPADTITVDNPVQPEEFADGDKDMQNKTATLNLKPKGLTGKIKWIFIRLARRYSSKVTPVTIAESSPNDDKPTLSVQVEDGRKSAEGSENTGITLEQNYEREEEGCVVDAQLIVVIKETTEMAALIPPEVLVTGDLQEEELESEPKVDEVSPVEPENEEIKIRKLAMISLVSNLIQRIIKKSGQRCYTPEKFTAIFYHLFEKLWIQTEPRVLSLSPKQIARQGKAIFKDLLKQGYKAETILLFLEAEKQIFEKKILSTVANHLQTRWNTLSVIKEAFKEATENLRENQHRLYIWI